MNNKTNYLISLIFNTGHLIREQSKRGKDRPDPFSVLRLETLRYVAEKENPLMREVADYFHITPPSVTSLVNPLAKCKLLTRVIDKNDRRVIRLSITPKGQEVLKKGFNKINNRLRKVLIKLNSKEQENLIKILEKLSKNYDKSNQK